MTQPSESIIRLLLADDHQIMREGLAMIFDNEPDMEVVAQADTGEKAIALYREHRPDITLMDLRMPGMSGVQAIETIRSEFAEARIIILTTYDGDEDIYRGLRAGAKSYLLKATPRQEALTAIRNVYAGKRHLPTEVGAIFAERMCAPNLSEREIEVLHLLAQGKTNKDIAAQLFVAESTIKFHVNNVMMKLDAADRTEAVVNGLKRGIIHLDDLPHESRSVANK